MEVQPDEEVLALFGARVVEPLGGRMNQHWLVEAGGERLVLRRWWQPADEVAYELRLLARVAALGWPVGVPVAGPLVRAGYHWTMAPFLPGEPPSSADPRAEQRARGRLLAELHADLARLGDLGQRGGWRRCEEILADETLDLLLADHAQAQPDEARALRWHLERARRRVEGIPLRERPGIIIHGDFTTWNLRFSAGRLSGLLDFELARWDHRVGDFTLAWRGKYDEVVYGYDEVAALEPEEWALITPLWWAFLVDQACQIIRHGFPDDGWTMRKLLERSPLMGPDADPYRA